MTKELYKPTVREVFTIPNIMGYIRILLIPVFMTIYIQADSLSDYRLAALIAGISAISDFFDGLIARKCNMVTELGKFIDPLSDKLSQAGMIVCLGFRYPFMRYAIALFVVKELFMGVMGIIMLCHNGRKLNGAKWYGKVCTAVLYTGMFILFVFPNLAEGWVNAIIGISILFMAFSFIMYIPVFHKMYHEE